MASGQADIMEVEGDQPRKFDPNSRAERLKARLYSSAPIMATPNPNALVFRGVTKAQARRIQNPLGPKVEPLVRNFFKFCLLNSTLIFI